MDIRLFAGFSLVVCVVASAARAQEITLLRPSITTLVVRPDTVWFCGTQHGTDNAAYYFARRPRTWGQSASPDAGVCANIVRTIEERDTVDAGEGVRIIRVTAPRGRDNVPLGRAFLRIVDTARQRSTDILRRLDPATLAKLPKLGDLDRDSVSTGIGGFTLDDSTVWIGLRGAFPEGEGAYGGLVRVDRRSGAVDWINDSLIVYRDIPGLADAGRWLIVGAVTDGEYGPFGEPGLLRYDKTSRQWRPYGDSVPLPDKLIRTLRDDGQLIAIATEMGLAVADLTRDNRSGSEDPLTHWSTTWFVPTFVGDSMTYVVGPKDQAPLTQEAEAPWVFAQRYAAIGHERPFHDAIAELPPRRRVQTTFIYDDDSASAALADPSLVPMLTTMLGREQSQRLAALALARLGFRPSAAVADSLHRQFVAGGHNRPALARALLAAGDSTPLQWARSILDSAVRTGPRRNRFDDVGNAAEILADARDKMGMGLVIAVASNVGPEMSNFMSRLLARFDDPAAWGTLLAYGSAGRLNARDVVMVLRPSALTDSIVHARARAFLRANLAVDSVSFMAILGVRNLGMIELAPVIIDQLRKPRAKGAAAGMGESMTLVALSGRSDAPIWTDSLPPAAVHDWWQQWWVATGNRATAAAPDEAMRALREWSTRFFAARSRK